MSTTRPNLPTDSVQPSEQPAKTEPSRKKDEPQAGEAPAAAARVGRSFRRRWPLWVLLIGIAGAAGGAAWHRFSLSDQDDSHIVLSGNVDVRQVNLGFKVDGRIADLAVDEGDAVTANQVVARLEKSYFEDDLRVAIARRDNAAANLARLEHGSRPEEVAESQAQVAQQSATLTRARQDAERVERLIITGAVSRENFDQARAALGETEARMKYAEESLRLVELGPRQEDIDAARAELRSQEAAVIQSQRRLADSDLIAPSDGVILTRAREKGAIVAAGETVFTLTLATPVWVRTYVNERDLGRIHPGMTAAIHTDSAANKSYRGQVGFISPTAEFTPKTVETRELRTDLVYRLRIIVANPDRGLRQGMPVTVVLDADARSLSENHPRTGAQGQSYGERMAHFAAKASQNEPAPDGSRTGSRPPEVH